MTAIRLPRQSSLDNQDETISFFWNNKKLKARKGDSISSALLSNKFQIIGRSFKYHRARGVTSAGVEEAGALVTTGKGAYTEPNVRASTTELSEGLFVYSQNAWPSVRFDIGSILNLFGRFFAAGFYYKTFMGKTFTGKTLRDKTFRGIPPLEWGRGTGIWMFFEKFIRKAAGLGTASRQADPDSYEHLHTHTDILVIGSGPAGIQSAIQAAQTGKEVLLVEQDYAIGGTYLSWPDKSEFKTQISKLNKQNITILTRTTAFGLYDDTTIGLVEIICPEERAQKPLKPRQRFHICRAESVILATGALERNYAFVNNDLPGIMTVSSARTYLNRYQLLVGSNIMISTNNDSAYEAGLELEQAGATVTILESREQIGELLLQQISGRRINLYLGSAVAKANHGVFSPCVKQIVIAQKTSDGWRQSGSLSCDCLLISAGWSPVIHLASHQGCPIEWNKENACFISSGDDKSIFFAGSAAGIWQFEDCIQSATQVARKTKKAQKQSSIIGGWHTDIEPLYEICVPAIKGKAFIDPQHDVTASDVRLAHQEGFISVEHLKRYTTLGMATDQGKMGNIIGLALMADALNRPISDVGVTRFRPPYTSISLGALAGAHRQSHFKPIRRTPFHNWSLANNGVMIDAGLWHRPWYYPKQGENLQDAYIREATITRRSLGICDVSSLGKIMIQGPDSTIFLNRIYTNPFAKLAVGKARYGIILREDGMVFDDGTTWRLSENSYLMTTTTNHAAAVMARLEELLQTRWPELRVHVTSITDQWAGCAIAGPNSRNLLSEIVDDPSEISNETLPFMGVKQVLLQTIPCYIARISFSGERAFEVYIPSDYSHAMMQFIWNKAQMFESCLYGLEALGTMRIEKGHVTGAEIDGRVTIEDIGLGKMASQNKDFVGSALRNREMLTSPNRPQLVGIFPKDKHKKFSAGALLNEAGKTKGHPLGWITAVTHSPALGHWIALGFIEGGLTAVEDKHIVLSDELRSNFLDVEIVSPHMYDPEGTRLHG